MPTVRDLSTEREKLTAKYRNWDELSEIADDADTDVDPFKDLIQRDPCVCDHCFTLRYTEVAHEWWRGDPELGWMEYNTWMPIPGRSEEVPADEPSKGTRLACSVCGHRRSKHRPIPETKLYEYAEHISETLHRKGIDHKQEVLFNTVEQRNTSENQGKPDSEIYAPAVKRAIAATDAPVMTVGQRSD